MMERDRFLSTLTEWFAWATDTPDTALDPLMVLALSIIIAALLAALIGIALWPLDEPRVTEDPHREPCR